MNQNLCSACHGTEHLADMFVMCAQARAGAAEAASSSRTPLDLPCWWDNLDALRSSVHLEELPLPTQEGAASLPVEVDPWIFMQLVEQVSHAALTLMLTGSPASAEHAANSSCMACLSLMKAQQELSCCSPAVCRHSLQLHQCGPGCSFNSYPETDGLTSSQSGPFLSWT